MMRVFTVLDHTGESTNHFAVGAEEAIQAHLVHFGLLGLEKSPTVTVQDLIDVKDRSIICWDIECCLVGAVEIKGVKPEDTPMGANGLENRGV